MELVVDLTETDGRVRGTVRRATSSVAHPFTGTLELLACLERLSTEDPGPEAPRRER
ncbi:hypothetical protein [Pseudonocardia pini]|uniref:hypothetical protein n=1 Tax=Pseudonocardia pini TaxID=2758030 RepID=UPI0015F0482B|nr:hypothetical protein [Pseudonocardia pini]